jgi:hypothetical protein
MSPGYIYFLPISVKTFSGVIVSYLELNIDAKALNPHPAFFKVFFPFAKEIPSHQNC